MTTISTFGKSTASPKKNPQDPINTTIALANTEQSETLPVGTKFFNFINRGLSTIKLAYTSGKSGTDYISVPGRGGHHEVDGIASDAPQITLYFQSTTAGGRIEIEHWT